MANRVDTFSRGDSNTALGTPSDAGSAWVALSGTWGIASNHGYCASSTGQNGAYLEASTSSADTQVTLSTISSDCGLIGWAIDDSNYVMLRANVGSGALELYQKVAGSFTQLGTSTRSLSGGDVLELRLQGTTAAVFVDGTQDATIGTPTVDVSLRSATKYGLHVASDTTSRFASFSVTDLAAASFTVTPSTIPANHSGSITLTLTGTGTTWASGSTVSVTNSVTGTTTVTKGTWTRTSNTAATLTVTTGAGTGTYTITVDGVTSPSLTVAAATLSLSPSSGNTSSTVSVTGTGSHTLWASDHPAFTVGGSGNSVSGQSWTNDTTSPLTLNTGSTPGTVTVTDPSTGATASFTINAPSVSVAVTDANWYWSMGNWDSPGAGAMLATNVRTGAAYAWAQYWGSYCVLGYTTTTSGNIVLNLDGSILGSDSVDIAWETTGGSGALQYGSYWRTANVTSGTTTVTLETALAAGTYATRIVLLDATQNNLWNAGASPYDALKITGATLPPGSSTAAPPLHTGGTALFFGDSLTEGDSSFNSNVTGASSYGSFGLTNYPQMVAHALDCEYGQIGVGSTGWGKSGLGNVPDATTFFPSFYSGRTRVTYADPTHVFFMWGVADATGSSVDATVTANVASVLAAARAKWPTSRFWIWVPVGRQKASAITSGFNTYQGSTPDPKCKLMDFGTLGPVSTWFSATSAQTGGTPTTNEGYHPFTQGHGIVAGLVSGFVQKTMAGGSASAPVGCGFIRGV